MINAADSFDHAPDMLPAEVSKPVAEYRGVSEDDIIERMECGDSIATIASDIGVSRSMLWRWLNENEDRSARNARARQLAAAAWVDKAEKELDEAMDIFGLAKAKEKAHHYRWHARVTDPQYGDKIDMKHSGDFKVHLDSGDGGIL